MDVAVSLAGVAFALVRFAVFACAALVFGAVPTCLLVLRPGFRDVGAADWEGARKAVAGRLEGLVAAGLAGAAAATLAGLALQAASVGLLGGPPASPDLSAVLGTSFGLWYLVRLVLLGALTVLLYGRVAEAALGQRASPAWWFLWGLLGAGVLATSSLSGHAAASRAAALAVPNDVVHLVAGATWFSGVVVLAVALPEALAGRSPEEAVRLLAACAWRFSRLALVAITVVAATGLAASVLHLRSPADLLGAGYGRALAVKLCLFAVVLGAGAVNHLRVRHRLREAAAAGADTPARMLLARTLALEVAAGVLILALTGILTGLPPPG